MACLYLLLNILWLGALFRLFDNDSVISLLELFEWNGVHKREVVGHGCTAFAETGDEHRFSHRILALVHDRVIDDVPSERPRLIDLNFQSESYLDVTDGGSLVRDGEMRRIIPVAFIDRHVCHAPFEVGQTVTQTHLQFVVGI